MELLAKDRRCYFSRKMPYEARLLTYLAKFASLWERTDNYGATLDHMNFSSSMLSVPSWAASNDTARDCLPTGTEMLKAMWQQVNDKILAQYPRAQFYAEKVPPWVPSVLKDVVCGYTIFLFRDPRDIFLSSIGTALKSTRQTAVYPELQHAINLSRLELFIYENFRTESWRQPVQALRYEDLITDTADAVQLLCDATGVSISDYNAPMYYESRRKSDPLERSVYRWKQDHFADEVNNCLCILLRDHLIEMGYEYEDIPERRARYWNFAEVVDGNIRAINDGIISAHQFKAAKIELTGDDCSLILDGEPFNADHITEVWLCLSGRVGDHCSIYWRDAQSSFGEDRAIHVKFFGADVYQIVRFETNKHPKWAGQVAELSVHLCNGHDTNPGEQIFLRWVRLIPNSYV